MQTGEQETLGEEETDEREAEETDHIDDREETEQYDKEGEE